jgi:hypothetical protein
VRSLSGHFTSSAIEPLNFVVDGKMHSLSLPAPFSVTGPESYLLATRLGLGLAQMPHFHIAEDLKRGSLVALLTQSPPPSALVSLMYARTVSSRRACAHSVTGSRTNFAKAWRETSLLPVGMSQKCQCRKYRTRRCSVGRSSGTILTFNPADEERNVWIRAPRHVRQRRYSAPCRTRR